MTAEDPKHERDQRDVPIDLDLGRPIWDRFFLPAPLVLVGTREVEGYDLAPKHMCMPIGWDNFFGFMCTPRHATYHNAQREGAFTVSLPRPDQLIATSLSAQPRDDSGSTAGLELLPTEAAKVVDGILLSGAYVQLECELERVIDDFGPNSLIVGRIVAARVSRDALRVSETADGELIRDAPVLVYLSPGRFVEVSDSRPFPFPADFHR